MQKSLSLFTTHLVICIAENETDGSKKIAFACPIATDDNIVMGRERFNDRLIFVAI